MAEPRSMNLSELSRVLRERREAIGIPKAEIARRVEVSESYIAMIEQGERRPSKAVLERWAEALGWDAVYSHQLLVLAGHSASEQDSAPAPRLPFAGGALHFPQPKRMERERVIQELQVVLKRAEISDKDWQETLKLLESFLEWLKFRLGEEEE
jgi:transcriptional regulator with XRE-family HTH domain